MAATEGLISGVANGAAAQGYGGAAVNPDGADWFKGSSSLEQLPVQESVAVRIVMDGAAEALVCADCEGPDQMVAECATAAADNPDSHGARIKLDNLGLPLPEKRERTISRQFKCFVLYVLCVFMAIVGAVLGIAWLLFKYDKYKSGTLLAPHLGGVERSSGLCRLLPAVFLLLPDCIRLFVLHPRQPVSNLGGNARFRHGDCDMHPRLVTLDPKAMPQRGFFHFPGVSFTVIKMKPALLPRFHCQSRSELSVQLCEYRAGFH